MQGETFQPCPRSLAALAPQPWVAMPPFPFSPVKFSAEMERVFALESLHRVSSPVIDIPSPPFMGFCVGVSKTIIQEAAAFGKGMPPSFWPRLWYTRGREDLVQVRREERNACILTQGFLASPQGLERAELVLKNGRVLDTNTGEIYPGDVAVEGGLVVGVGEYAGREEIDLGGRLLCPGFVDAHLHLESCLANPAELVLEAARHGTLAFIVDPHEVANVAGGAGIAYLMNA